MMSARHEHALEVFRLRCWARAELYAIGEYDLHEAVDALQAAAVASGLVAEIGQDAVQAIMAEAFAAEKEVAATAASPDAFAVWDAPGWHQAIANYHEDRAGRVLIVEPQQEQQTRTAASTLDAAAWLAFRVKDAERWRAWLDRHSAAERADIVEHLTNIKQRRRRAA